VQKKGGLGEAASEDVLGFRNQPYGGNGGLMGKKKLMSRKDKSENRREKRTGENLRE